MRTIRPGGLIVPTALFVAMFVLLLCTVLLTSVSYNLGLSMDSLESTEYRYLSLGVMNELLSDLNGAKVDVRDFTKSRPRRVNTGGTMSEAWVEPLTGGKSYLVVAQSYRSRGSKPQVVKSLCTFEEFDLGRVYTNVVDDNPSTPDPIYYSDLTASGNWSQLPPAPRMRYTGAGTVEVRAGESAGTLPFVTGGPDGSLYAVYSPGIDGWDDSASPAIFDIPFPISMPWGQLTRRTIAAGNRQGRTIGELSVIVQAMIDHLFDVSISQGALTMKYSQDQGKWIALPPPEEATAVNGQIRVQAGQYHLQGISGPPSAYEGGIVCPVFRKGQDLIYNYREDAGKWDISKPPGQDIMYLTADTDGTPYVQSGIQQQVFLDYFLRVLLGDLSNIEAGAVTTKLHKRENSQWVEIPDPPAQYFKKSGPPQLVDRPYSGAKGPRLGGMVASGGELTVVNRPPAGSNLVDTIYKYRQGKWELVPPPPNKHFDPTTGNEVQDPGLASKLELGIGADGKLILRVPAVSGPNSIFMQTKGGDYDLLPPVKNEGGPYENFLSQTTGGRKRDGSSKGSYVVKATYF
jgi:hypothetical protein